ncbi:hypothetical protein [Propionibacterium cyclohexanicum]|uniref:hypothetical protein n=1 Tax=Propionibacterium cyclohexanicum TaxID=64702 RepID=UPI00116008CE|nr:hypothetical protein [Propionibacterium cyclohexanicum]
MSRTRSIACRLLAGSGSARLVAYRWAPCTTIDSLVHGVTTHGELVVATCSPAHQPDDPLLDAQPVEVRLSILKDAADPSVRINSAAVHALGTLEWVPECESTQMLVTDELPVQVAAIAAGENGRLGIVRARRILVHDATGITPVALSDLRQCLAGSTATAPFPCTDEELDAYHEVLACGEETLCRITDAVSCGLLPGRELTRRPLREGCVHIGDRVYCADVDRTGMVLVKVGAESTETVFAPFPVEVDSIETLSAQLEGLVRDSAAMALPGR